MKTLLLNIILLTVFVSICGYVQGQSKDSTIFKNDQGLKPITIDTNYIESYAGKDLISFIHPKLF